MERKGEGRAHILLSFVCLSVTHFDGGVDAVATVLNWRENCSQVCVYVVRRREENQWDECQKVTKERRLHQAACRCLLMAGSGEFLMEGVAKVAVRPAFSAWCRPLVAVGAAEPWPHKGPILPTSLVTAASRA